MNAGNLNHIGERLKDERTRLGLSQVAFSDACGVNRGTLATWEKGEQSPTAAVLSAMAGLGLDVLYVLTGKYTPTAAGSLTQEEAALVERLRKGSPALRGYLQEVGGTQDAKGNTVAIGGDVGQAIAGDASFSAPVSFGGRGKKIGDA